MPESSRIRNPMPWLALFALVAVAGVWWPQAQAQNGVVGSPIYRYAVISFQGNDAIVYYDGGTTFYEGPDILKPERVEGNNNLRKASGESSLRFDHCFRVLVSHASGSRTVSTNFEPGYCSSNCG